VSRYSLRKVSRRIAPALLAALVVAAVAVPSAGSIPPIKRAVLIVINGKGVVKSTPHGIACPKTCRGYFPKDSRVHLVAQPAAGWKVASWKGDCTSKTARCAFWLTTEHECSAQLCRVGAFGVRVYFVRSSSGVQ
jgi:hypothetical protein